jgi:hypothetical protein
MQTNYLLTDTSVIRTKNKQWQWPLTEKSLRRKAGNNVHVSLDDFLRKHPIATLNRFGDRVISGTRIC